MRELVNSYEMWDTETDEFDHNVTIWKEGDNFYQFRHSGRGSFNLDSLPMPAPIPMKLFMGRWHTSLTESPQPIPTDSFLKSPLIILDDDYTSDGTVKGDKQNSRDFRAPGSDMFEEAKIYEILKQHPHPNICIYYGCVRNGDYFTAICLKKYERSVYDAVTNGDGTLVPHAVLGGISKGLHFLHALGLVHNDINPANIMLDHEGNAVIIDFDSCMPVGQEIGSRKAGTFGWIKEPALSISVPENDFYGLTLIAKFMEQNDTNNLSEDDQGAGQENQVVGTRSTVLPSCIE